MAPPMSYYNSAWGRRHSDFDTASSSPSLRRMHSRFSAHTPTSPRTARPCHCKTYPCSPSPQSGSISDVPSTRIPGRYGHVAAASLRRGYAPPSREQVKGYVERELPATPTSTSSSRGSVVEMIGGGGSDASTTRTNSVISAREILGGDGRVCGITTAARRGASAVEVGDTASRRSSFSLLPTPTSTISAHEIVGADGRICGLSACDRRRGRSSGGQRLSHSHSHISTGCVPDRWNPDSPTPSHGGVLHLDHEDAHGKEFETFPATVMFKGRAYVLLDHCTAARSASDATRSTVNSSVCDTTVPEKDVRQPGRLSSSSCRSPAWKVPVRKRTRWTLMWMSCFGVREVEELM